MSKRQPAPPAESRGWLIVISATFFFAVLSMLPVILPALHLQLHPTAPQTSYGVTLMVAPRNPHSVHVPAVAQPIQPGLPPAALPRLNASREAATVAAEDKRLRTVLHSASRVFQPEVVPVRGSLPTLVLTAGTYTAQTLVEYGAMVMLPHDAALVIDNIYVSTNASLSLGGPTLHTLYLDSGSGGFASIVAWGGNLTFTGTAARPLTVMGWDRSASAPAVDQGYGRSYIREAGGRMTLSDVRASSLGFWSGRTGGIAWTGLTGQPSTGQATDSTFTNDTYGAFVARGSGVTFSADLFEFNQLDGLHVHRYSVGTRVVSSSASRNGGNGFLVSPASERTKLENDISVHNDGNGFFLDGKPLASGASASGGSVAPGVGTVAEYSESLRNRKIGILVEGGRGTVIKGDQVCGGVTAIEIKDGATNAVVTGNTVSCAPRSGFSVGPGAPGTILSGNAVSGARTAFLIRNSGKVQLDKNLVTNAAVFGVSARGGASSVTGVGNTIAGSGFRAIDFRADAPAPALYGSDTAGWTHHVRITFLNYLRFHPLAALWLGIALIVVLAWLMSKRRRLPSHPYPASTRWRPESVVAEAATAQTPELVSVRQGYEPPSGYERRSAYEPPSGYEPQSGYEPRSGYTAQADHTALPEYDPPGSFSWRDDADELMPPTGMDEFHADGEGASQTPTYTGTAPRQGPGARPPWETMPMPQVDGDAPPDGRNSAFAAYEKPFTRAVGPDSDRYPDRGMGEL